MTREQPSVLKHLTGLHQNSYNFSISSTMGSPNDEIMYFPCEGGNV